MYKKIFQILVIVSLCAIFAIGQNKDAVNRIDTQISEITTGKNSSERGLQIREELEKMRVKYSYEPFTAKSRRGDAEFQGWNIVAEVSSPTATKTLMIGAHYDKVEKGVGAVDNASGSIAVLELLKAFKDNPLKNYNLKVGFWDLEEKGLLGAGEYVKAYKDNLPEIYINFDVFGYGDTLWLWAKDDSASFAKAFDTTSKSMKFSSVIGKDYPPSDHLVFAPHNVETYSFSLLNKKERENLVKLLKGEKLSPKDFPAVIKTIHTENDNLKKIDTTAIAKAIPIVEAAIRSLDK